MKPQRPVHPGEMLLEEFLRPMGVSQRQFASKLGWTAAKLNELVKGKRGVTAETALDLAQALVERGRINEAAMHLQVLLAAGDLP